MDEVKTKVCSNPNCIHNGEPQPVSNFTKDRTKKDGYRTRCKDCDHAYLMENHDKVLERDRKRYQKRRLRVLEQKKEYEARPARYDLYYEQLCQFDPCRQDPENPELLQVACKYCGNWFNPTNSQVKHRIHAINCGFKNKVGESNLYCSKGCKRACPTYGQYLYPKDFLNGSSREVQPELRKMVLERDNWTCQRCGDNKEENPEIELHCHHIFPLNEDPVCSADMDNCIIVCIDCHRWIHQNIPGCGYAELKCTK